MNARKKNGIMQWVGDMRQALAMNVASKLGQIIPLECLMAMVEKEAPHRRERVYPPLVTLGLFVEQVLDADQACQDAVARGLSQRTALGLAPCSLNSGPFCKARQRLPLSLLRNMAEEVGRHCEATTPHGWRWRGRRIYLLDGTTVSMPDTEASQRAFPQNREQQPGLGFPLARIVGLISLCAGHIKAWAVSACEGKGNGEIPQSRLLLDAMETDSLLIADRGFCSWFLLALVLARGNDAVVRLHQRRSPNARVAKVLGCGDALQVWPRPDRPDWLDEQTYQSLPDELSVRVVTDRDWHIATTLLDSGGVPREEIATLYRDRWHIELDFRSIKQTMQMDILRCRTPEMVKKEIAAHLLGYNLTRALMIQAAVAGKALPRSLSFIGAKRLLCSFQARLRHYPEADFMQEFTCLLAGIAQLRLPHRPDRVEPRAIKRRPKPRAMLHQPRQVARQSLMASRVGA